MNTPPEKPPHSAVVLKYSGDAMAPRVVAKGEGLLAQKIIEIARQHNIPLYEDAELVKILSKLDVNDEIPVSLYVAVAEVLAFVYHLSGKTLPTKQADKP
ncbi:MAG: EscU/YscU/HrcU family type III secretion system export apparatus switch protein [Gammaproteobacteria bacterium]|nr:EscU/YscU/HrcU family type III secretion system export apparatus switch protein [Gammaproteobacteria bacterium]